MAFALTQLQIPAAAQRLVGSTGGRLVDSNRRVGVSASLSHDRRDMHAWRLVCSAADEGGDCLVPGSGSLVAGSAPPYLTAALTSAVHCASLEWC